MPLSFSTQSSRSAARPRVGSERVAEFRSVRKRFPSRKCFRLFGGEGAGPGLGAERVSRQSHGALCSAVQTGLLQTHTAHTLYCAAWGAGTAQRDFELLLIELLVTGTEELLMHKMLLRTRPGAPNNSDNPPHTHTLEVDTTHTHTHTYQKRSCSSANAESPQIDIHGTETDQLGVEMIAIEQTHSKTFLMHLSG